MGSLLHYFNGISLPWIVTACNFSKLIWVVLFCFFHQWWPFLPGMFRTNNNFDFCNHTICLPLTVKALSVGTKSLEAGFIRVDRSLALIVGTCKPPFIFSFLSSVLLDRPLFISVFPRYFVTTKFGRRGSAFRMVFMLKTIIEPPHDKTNKIAWAPSEDSDQPEQQPSLIRVFAVRMKKAWLLSYPLSAQRMPRPIWVFAGRKSFCWFCHEAAHMRQLLRKMTLVLSG